MLNKMLLVINKCLAIWKTNTQFTRPSDLSYIIHLSNVKLQSFSIIMIIISYEFYITVAIKTVRIDTTTTMKNHVGRSKKLNLPLTRRENVLVFFKLLDRNTTLMNDQFLNVPLLNVKPLAFSLLILYWKEWNIHRAYSYFRFSYILINLRHYNRARESLTTVQWHPILIKKPKQIFDKMVGFYYWLWLITLC